jgi:hypothetical protein
MDDDDPIPATNMSKLPRLAVARQAKMPGFRPLASANFEARTAPTAHPR